MLLAIAAAATLVALAWVFMVRAQDLPEPTSAPPWHHLEGRKASIYENLRDLQFEYRVGKLSDADYLRTKQELQAELATVLAEIDQMKGTPAAAPGPAARPAPAPDPLQCPHCNAKFDKPMKFCGECGKAMGANV